MKLFTIKFETYDGKVKVRSMFAYNRQAAINKLINCREIYWVKEK
jgi:hypothetical protein